MKYLFAVLALLVAVPVSAADKSVLVIVAGQAFSGSNVSNRKDNEQVQQMQLYFKRAGLSYSIIRGPAAKTHWVRRGTYQLANGDSITHASVVVVGFQVGRYATAPAGFRPDSLTFVACAPTVPIIFLGASFPVFTQTSACSTGVDSDVWNTLSATDLADSTYFANGLPFHGSGGIESQSGLTWRLQDKVGSFNNAGTTYGAGTWRALVTTWNGASITTCIDCDSTRALLGGGPHMLWMRQMDHVSGAKPVYFVCAFNGLSDGFVRTGGSAMFALAMASADSFSNGQIFGDYPKPLTASLFIEGLFKRRATASTNKGGTLGMPGATDGVVVPDSVAITAQLDSIAINFPEVPVTFGVEVDSIYIYPRDYYYAIERFPRWYVAPFGYAGQTAQTFGQNASFQVPSTRGTWHRPLDMLGRSRLRFAIGDGDFSIGTKDSSLCALVSGSFNALAIRFGRDRVSRSIVPLPGDYSAHTAFDAVGRDSFFSALYNGGARALISTTRGFTTYENSVPHITQQNYRVPYGDHVGSNLKLLIAGRIVSTIGAERSIEVSTEYAQYFYDGLFLGTIDSNYPGQAGGARGTAGFIGSSSILVLDISHFGTGSNGRWNMFGWRYFKYSANVLRTYNKLAGRTLATWVKPEDVEP